MQRHNFVAIYNETNGKISLAKSIKLKSKNQFQNVLLKKEILVLKRQLEKQKNKNQQVNILAQQIKEIKLKIVQKLKQKQENQKKLLYNRQLRQRGLIRQEQQFQTQSQSEIKFSDMQKSQKTIKKQSLIVSNSLSNTPSSQIYWNNFPLNQSKTFHEYMDQKSSQNQNYSSRNQKKDSSLQSVRLNKSHSMNTKLNNLKKLRQQNSNFLFEQKNN